MDAPWIGVDFDGTLAEYDKWQGPDHCGAPIPDTVRRIKRWIANGHNVRIFTARVSTDGTFTRDLEALAARGAIRKWCRRHVGQVLPVTCCKDYGMIELYDDRAVAVEQNTGRLLNPSTRGLDETVRI